ncbi:SPOSA6832_03994, partial [Sporobolomyces salmonicolor]
MPPAVWHSTPHAPPDAIFALTAGYLADTFDKKVNLGVGAYRDNEGKPFVLPVVRKAKAILANDDSLDHEYLPIAGLPSFVSATSKLIFGADSPALKEGRVASSEHVRERTGRCLTPRVPFDRIQTISGTGANHYGGAFLERFYEPWLGKKKEEKIIYLSDPTWALSSTPPHVTDSAWPANHKSIFASVGLTTVDYPYYDPATIGLALPKYLDFLRSAPNQSVFLLHACAHNPTGVDPTRDEWKEIAEIFQEKGHFAFFDCAYQGFASGDLDNDAWAVRHFVSSGIPLLVCQSYAKNAGLYGERIGALNIVATHGGEGPGGAARVKSQLLILQRQEISNPPTFGARIMSLILNDEKLFEEWRGDIATMAHRIIAMREKLFDLLTHTYKTPAPGPNGWEHVKKQIGATQQCKALVGRGHIYLTGNGRVSMAGLNEHNVVYVAECIDKAVRGSL